MGNLQELKGRTVVKLAYPINAKGTEIGEVQLRRPRVADLKKIDLVKGEFDKGLMLLVDLSGLEPEAVHAMDAADFVTCSGVIAGFLEGASPSGTTSGS